MVPIHKTTECRIVIGEVPLDALLLRLVMPLGVAF